jgi:hypothetical protein
LEGFRAILLRPSFGLAEIAWRWSFGASATLLVAISFFEYLNTLPVSKSDLLLLRTTQPPLILRALQHIFRGSGFRAVAAIILLVLALGIIWIVIASLARAATLRALLAHFREREISTSRPQPESRGHIGSLLTLNFLRFAMTLAAVVGCLAAIVLGNAAARPPNPVPGSAFLIILTIAMLAWLAWSTLNWFLSVAAIFVIADGQDTFGAIASTVNLCQSRPGSIFAAGTWFGVAHLTALVVASSVVGFPLGFASILPAGAVLGGVLLVTLLYFAIADFLYAGRLAAYLAIAEMPALPSPAEPIPPSLPPHLYPEAATPPSSAVDAGELILSDIPCSS